MNYFITKTELKDITAIDVNSVTKNIDVAIKDVHTLKMQDILGELFMNDLLTKKESNSLSSAELTLVNDYIKPTVANYILYELYDTMLGKITDTGINIQVSSNVQEIDSQLYFSKRKWQLNKAEEYEQRLRKYLCNNTSLFPLYTSQTGTNLPQNNDIIAGVYLGNTANYYRNKTINNNNYLI